MVIHWEIFWSLLIFVNARVMFNEYKFSEGFLTLYLWWLVSTKRSYILKHTWSSQLQVCLSMCDLLMDTRH